LSIQYASATGTGNFGANSTQLTELPNVMLQPGQYYLVQQAAGTKRRAAAHAGLGRPADRMSGTAGKVALVDGTTGSGATVAARCAARSSWRGSSTWSGSATRTSSRARVPPHPVEHHRGHPCRWRLHDTDDNAADFTAVAPAPRNSSSPAEPLRCDTSAERAVVPVCEDLTIARGQAGSVTLSASDADGTVVDATITSTPVDGISLRTRRRPPRSVARSRST
jgi:uncharacterized protein